MPGFCNRQWWTNLPIGIAVCTACFWNKASQFSFQKKRIRSKSMMYLPYYKLWTKPRAFLFFSLLISPQDCREKPTLFQELHWLYNRHVYVFRVLSREENGNFFFSVSIDFFKPPQEEKEATGGGQYQSWRTKMTGQETLLFTSACSGPMYQRIHQSHY